MTVWERIKVLSDEEPNILWENWGPGLDGAPLVESRVCQYTNTPDGDFILDRHPAAGNCWLIGGGSGHGFKHGPALGELAAAQILERRDVEPTFALARFEAP